MLRTISDKPYLDKAIVNWFLGKFVPAADTCILPTVEKGPALAKKYRARRKSRDRKKEE